MKKDAPVHPKIAKPSFVVEVLLTPKGEIARSDERNDRGVFKSTLTVSWLELCALTHTTKEGVIGWIEPFRVFERLVRKRLIMRSKNPRAYTLTDRGRSFVHELLRHVERLYSSANITLDEVLWEARDDARSIVFDIDGTLEIVELKDPKEAKGSVEKAAPMDWCGTCGEPIEFSEAQCRWKHKKSRVRTRAVDHVALPIGW